MHIRAIFDDTIYTHILLPITRIWSPKAIEEKLESYIALEFNKRSHLIFFFIFLNRIFFLNFTFGVCTCVHLYNKLRVLTRIIQRDKEIFATKKRKQKYGK
jgi:hypothetical protein